MFNRDVDVYEEYVYRKRIFKGLKDFQKKYNHILKGDYQTVVKNLLVMFENDLSDLEDELWRIKVCKECGSDLNELYEEETNATLIKCPICGYVEV